MKTKKEIKAEIAALKAVRPKIRPHDMFGGDNLAQLDAQIAVLENDWDLDDVYDEYDHCGVDDEILMSAETAIDWRNGKLDEDLAEDLPLKPEF